ncbi:demethylmenaquinone methyltransferase/2-methoxy-6-polyprenyl-1,4-benzoquinol methylase [Halalkaliarchaeum desulfuricum]|uniref:Demethylmenaquinone methyltransferase/2-methoxy-6-polyprenyl-1,4-benzoquinol methylase n=1 Tax=Halalkaliarchaeum desulfuricum TaxID=2055893 RepID=A0A343TNJ7_9EURY|nr:class I SAM-dependent methyltransferase [Halalkaliarchaeum desulfuricum]AUX10669.1 demethylmenaquinone methyltransferase/2-methoxy-6-polyprenyl-1,4-benzoquinol methylase [Halalkaliarchaeum desulfuricum]
MRAESSTPATNETVVAAYDRLAAPYDLLIAPLEAKTRRRAIEGLQLEPGETVLEIGCGPGHALRVLSRHTSPDGHVIGLDASPNMLARARSRVERSMATDRIDPLNRIDLLLGDARSLPLPDGSVDVVFIEDTLELFSSDGISTVVAECARVLGREGKLGVVTMERSGMEGDPFVRLYEWLFDRVPGYERVGCRPIYARRAIEDGGFTIERQERHRRGYVWPVEILIARHD